MKVEYDNQIKENIINKYLSRVEALMECRDFDDLIAEIDCLIEDMRGELNEQ